MRGSEPGRSAPSALPGGAGRSGRSARPRRAGADRTAIHHVVLDEAAHTWSVSQEDHRSEHSAGVDGSGPSLSAATSTFHGVATGTSVHKEWGLGDDGSLEKKVDYSLDTREIREILRAAGEQTGWSEASGPGASTGARVGLAVGLAVAAVVLVAVVVLLVVLLL